MKQMCHKTIICYHWMCDDIKGDMSNNTKSRLAKDLKHASYLVSNNKHRFRLESFQKSVKNNEPNKWTHLSCVNFVTESSSKATHNQTENLVLLFLHHNKMMYYSEKFF